MYQDFTNISLALSEVMEEIGVSESIVMKRRRAKLLDETTMTICHRMIGDKNFIYKFGSQSEGTTTEGLRSDSDELYCYNGMNIITDWSEWEHGANNHLIIQDENTAPGYCMLQLLRPDARLPIDEPGEHSFRDQQGRVVWKTSFIHSTRSEGEEQHGPAFTNKGPPGYTDGDQVFAFPCKSLLPEVHQWLSQQTPGRWPTEDMKKYIANSACFVVPVGCRGSVNEDLEWRISTSLPERCLMFSLNITQIQVYVLMKMLLPRININVPAESHISSFMCKTVVLHCIQNTDHNAWQSHNLINCLMICLSVLSICVINESCPHFIIRDNNLMSRKFTPETKHCLFENMKFLFKNFVPDGLFTIQTDSIGHKLIMKFTHGNIGLPNQHNIINHRLVIDSAIKLQGLVRFVYNQLSHRVINNKQIAMILKYMRYLKQIHVRGNALERSACTLLVPGLCTIVGSLLAATCIQNGHVVSQEALDYFSLGLNSDVASSRLKLASILYCAGDIGRGEAILRDVENRFDYRLCETVCGCYKFPKQALPSRTGGLKNITNIQHKTATCVIFSPNEINCAPPELKHELFRSALHDLPQRGRDDDWMDWAVVDSLPYLYYLQYKTCQRYLARNNDRQRALIKLMLTINVDPNLGHKETIYWVSA